jgi:hypothetical protein
MPTDDRRPPPLSQHARHVFGLLAHRSGTMRIGPLVAAAGLSCDELATAVNELAERCWVKVTWRRPRVRLPPGVPERWREVERVTSTAFGRWRYSVTW